MMMMVFNFDAVLIHSLSFCLVVVVLVVVIDYFASEPSHQCVNSINQLVGCVRGE